MFLQGTYTNGNEENKDILDFQSLNNYEQIKTISTRHFSVNSRAVVAAQWYATPTITMMLNLFEVFFKNNIQAYWLTHAYFQKTTETIENNPFDILISATTGGTSPFINAPTLAILHVKRGQTIFKKINESAFFTEIKPLSLALQKSTNHSIRVLQHKDNPLSWLILTTQYDWDLTRKIMALIPKFFELDIPEDLAQACIAMGNGNYETWKTHLQNFLKNNDVLAKAKKANIANVLTRYSTIQRESLQALYNDVRHHLEDILHNYTIRLTEKNRLAKALTESETDLTDHIETFFRNPYLTAININSNNQLFFTVAAPVRFYDEEELKYYIDNKKSAFKNTKINTFYEECLVSDKKKYDLFLETAFVICPGDPYVKIITNVPLTKGLPNEHLQQYRCWGAHGPEIIKAAQLKNYTYVLDLCVATVGNLNFADGIVTSSFYNRLKAYFEQQSPIGIHGTTPALHDLETNKRITLKEWSDKYDANKTV